MSTVRILYVDDEPDIREVAGLSLELESSFEVRCCQSGADALIEAARWKPDMILLDVMMPGMDGPATLALMKADDFLKDIPVVFVTARSQEKDIRAYVALGAKGVIPKPFDPMGLAGAVKAYL